MKRQRINERRCALYQITFIDMLEQCANKIANVPFWSTTKCRFEIGRYSAN